MEPISFLFHGKGSFTFPNGDIYQGEYVAHRFGLVWREGIGMYTTHDGQIYNGIWKDDKLVENADVCINYADGTEFNGKLYKSKYRGPGLYKLDNGLKLSCEFQDNMPVGDVCLLDSTNHIWTGRAEKNQAILFHENIYYNALCRDKGIGSIKQRRRFEKLKQLKPNKNLAKKVRSQQLTEDEVFHKTTKTVDDVDFCESRWCQDYLEFKKTKAKINAKIHEEDLNSLTDSEKDWWSKYKAYKEKHHFNVGTTEKMKKSVPVDEQPDFEDHDDDDGELAIKVIYPTGEKMRDREERVYVDQFDSKTSMETVRNIFKFYESGGKYDQLTSATDLNMEF